MRSAIKKLDGAELNGRRLRLMEERVGSSRHKRLVSTPSLLNSPLPYLEVFHFISNHTHTIHLYTVALARGRALVPGTEAGVALMTGAAVGLVPVPDLVPVPSPARGQSPHESAGGSLAAALARGRDQRRDTLILAASLLLLGELPGVEREERRREPLAAGLPRMDDLAPRHQTRRGVALLRGTRR